MRTDKQRSVMKTQRIASLWLPRLPIERWLKASGGSDDADKKWRIVLVVEAAHGQLVHASTAAAEVRRGTRLTDARAIDPGLAAVAADVAGDAALLGEEYAGPNQDELTVEAPAPDEMVDQNIVIKK